MTSSATELLRTYRATLQATSPLIAAQGTVTPSVWQAYVDEVEAFLDDVAALPLRRTRAPTHHDDDDGPQVRRARDFGAWVDAGAIVREEQRELERHLDLLIIAARVIDFPPAYVDDDDVQRVVDVFFEVRG